MSDRLKDLHEQRMKAIGELRAITDKAHAEKREFLTDEEHAKHAELFKVQERLQQQLQAEQRSLDLAREEARKEGDREQEKRGDTDGSTRPEAGPEYRAAFQSFLTRGMNGLNADEVRALQAGVASQGGYTVMPELMASQLLKSVDDAVRIRGLATKFQVMGAASLGVVTLDADPADADWTTELATGGEDSSMAFGKRKMVPSPFAKRIKVSNDLLMAAARGGTNLPIEQFIRDRLAYKFAITEEKAFISGTGVNQALGLFTAHPDGIPTSRDYSTGNTSTAITFDNLRGTRFQVKDQYRSKAKWMFHRTAIERIAKLRDDSGASAGTGGYLWEPSNKVGEPDMLLGNEVMSSEYAPNTFTSGLYVGLFGDFSFYWIADALDMTVQRVVELYAETNQTGFIGRAMCDGQPVMAEAFTRIKLG